MSLTQNICRNLHSKPIGAVEAFVVIEMTVCVTDRHVDAGSVANKF
jgi:hypothetical protein